MTNVNNSEPVAGIHNQAQDGPSSTEPPQSMQLILPPVAGTSKFVTEKRWRNILSSVRGMGVDVELLLLKSAITGTLKMTPAVFFVVNQAGSAASTPEQVFQAIDSTFPSQVTMGSQWICSPSPGNAADVIRRNIEKLRMARQANQTVFSHAVWCRVDEAGIMKRAVIDLSQDPSPVQFRAVTEKTTKKKAPTQSQTPRTIQRTIQMSNISETRKLTQDRHPVGTNEFRQDHRTCKNDSADGESSFSIPGMPDIIEFCVNGARWLDMNR